MIIATVTGYVTGGSFNNESFQVDWIGNCACTGGSLYGTPNPIVDVTLRIGDFSYDFGDGIYGVFGPLAQNITVIPGQLDINTGPFFNGAFDIGDVGGHFTNTMVIFDGVLQTPSPVVGDGWVILLGVMLCLFLRWRRTE